tara:strand:+ start:516 stop:686 length:171 start_codon:yes stop_codon:yes gene_type:complete
MKQQPCPDCDDGDTVVTIYKPQSFGRDIGEPFEITEHCQTCGGSGEIETEEDEKDE